MKTKEEELEAKVKKLTEMLRDWNGCNVCKNSGTKKCYNSNCGDLELPLFEVDYDA